MGLAAILRFQIKAARKRGAWPIRLLDIMRQLPTPQGRAVLWTRIAHRRQVHQTSPYTAADRYPELFDLAVRMAPDAGRILSFGCSTGEELVALHRRFPSARLVGAEINPRSRRIAAKALAASPLVRVVRPDEVRGQFDIIFALAVLQREPMMIEETRRADLSRHYPFARFDAAISDLCERLRPGGLLCVFNSQYRVEDSSAAARLTPVPGSPKLVGGLFGPDGQRLVGATGQSMFRRR